MLTRRDLLRGTTALCAAAAVAGSVRPARAAIQLAEAEQAAFLRLSRELTGFEDLDEELARHFAAYLAEAEPDAWRALIDSAQASGEAPPSSESLAALTRRIAKLWYSGWTEPADGVPPAVRAAAYRESLAWRALALPPRGTPTGRLWQIPAD